MKATTFVPRPGIDRVCFGADPRIEVTPSSPHRTSDPLEIAELLENPFLTVRKTAAKKATSVRAPRAKIVATRVTPDLQTPGGEQS